MFDFWLRTVFAIFCLVVVGGLIKAIFELFAQTTSITKFSHALDCVCKQKAMENNPYCNIINEK